MKAALLLKTGNPEDLKNNLVLKEIPVPEIKTNEVLVQIKSASINRRDLFISKGLYPKINLPVVLGSDCSGIIHSKGKNVDEFENGDEVLINPGMNWGDNENFQSIEFKILGMPDNGTFAEFVKIEKSYLYRKPAHLDFEQASAIPLAGVTAFRALYKKANLTEKDNILITGIGGGVSSLALSFALKTCENVFVTSGSDIKIAKAVSLGANAGVNYNEENWHKKISEISENKINVVIDSSGGETYSKCLEILNPGGRIVSYGASNGNSEQFNIFKLYWKQHQINGTTMGSDKDFAEMMEFINFKKIYPVIDSVLSMSEIHKGFAILNSSEQIGKIVLKN